MKERYIRTRMNGEMGERVAHRHWSAVAHDLPREEKRPGRRGRRRNEGRNKRDGKSRKNTDRGEIVARRYY